MQLIIASGYRRPAAAHPSRDAIIVQAKALARQHGSAHVLAVDGETVTEQAEYRRHISKAELERAEAAIGFRLRSPWREYLAEDVWFCRGWMHGTDAYVSLFSAAESVEPTQRFGKLVIGTNGALETLFVCDDNAVASFEDGRDSPWVLQAESLEHFVNAVEDGSFDFDYANRGNI